ncbi:MAG: peptidylprolyl isomerase [Sphingomonadales bacterium]|nr:peptidylprolyl isomerase [Sphingomonadales bacterium]
MSSKEQGGNLGQVGPGDMVAEFEQALFALEAGALCLEPVKTRFGVHVVRAGRREEPNCFRMNSSLQRLPTIWKKRAGDEQWPNISLSLHPMPVWKG